MGGLGKSVIATALTQDEEIQAAFPDGVFWLGFGQQPKLKELQRRLANALGDNLQVSFDDQENKDRLRELLYDKTCLLILDDIWQDEHLMGFNVLSSNCRMLFTTRDSKLTKGLEDSAYQLDLLSDDLALELLAKCTQQSVESLKTMPVSSEVTKECGNLPLALALVGAMIKGKPSNRWYNILEKLRQAELEKIQQHLPNYPYPDLLKAIQVSIDALEPHVKKRYLDFAVFPTSILIPEAVLQTFWALEGLNEFNTQDIIDQLVDRSLVRRDEKSQLLSLHDLLSDYVKKEIKNVAELHNRFLEAYRVHCPEGWHTWSSKQDNGYLFEHLAYHLIQAGKQNELYELLIGFSTWRDIKRQEYSGEASYLKDLKIAINSLPDTEPLESNQLHVLIKLYATEFLVLELVRQYTNTDLETLVWIGKENEAINYVNLYENPSDRLDSLLTIHDTLIEKNKDATSLLKEVEKLIDSLEEPDFNLLNKLMISQVKAGDLEKARKNISKNWDILLRLYGLIELAIHYTLYSNSNVLTKQICDEIEEGFKEFEKSNLYKNLDSKKTYTYVLLLINLAQIHLKIEERNKLNQVIIEAISSIQKIEQAQYRDGARLELISLLVGSGNLEQVEEIFQEIEDFTFIQGDIWINMAIGYINLKDTKKAYRFLELAEKVALENLNNTGFNILLKLANIHASLGKVGKVNKILENAFNFIDNFQGIDKSRKLSDLANTFGKLGFQIEQNTYIEKANQYLKLLPKKGRELEIKKYIEELIMIGKLLLQQGQRQTAIDFFNQAKVYIDQNPRPRIKIQYKTQIDTIIISYDTLQEAQSKIQEISDSMSEIYDTLLYSWVCRLVHEHQLLQAEEEAQKIKSIQYKAEARNVESRNKTLHLQR